MCAVPDGRWKLASFGQNAAPTSPDLIARLAAVAGLLIAPVVAWIAVSDPVRAAGVAAAGVAGLVLLVRRDLIVYGLIAGMMFNRVNFSAGFAVLGFGDLMAVAAVGVWIVSRVTDRSVPRLPSFWPLAIIYFVLCALSLVASNASGRYYMPLWRQGAYTLAAIALVDHCRSERVMRNLLWILAVSALLHAAFALEMGGRRLTGLALTPNFLARVLAICTIPAIALYQSERRPWVNVFLLATMSISAVALVLTQSRGTWLAMVIALLWWVRHNWRYFVAIAIAAGVIGLTASVVLEEGTSKMVAQRLEFRDNSVYARRKILKNGVRAVMARPFLGVGFAQFTDIEKVVDIRAASDFAAHNHYLSVAAETGVPSLLVLLAILAISWRSLSRRHREIAAVDTPDGRRLASTLAAIQAVYLYQLVDLLYKGAGPLILWILVGLAAAAGQIRLPAAEPSEPRKDRDEPKPEAPATEPAV